jgi:hypothetical protein
MTEQNKGPAGVTDKPLISLAHPERFERPTLGSVDRCSIQLSYGCPRKAAGNMADRGHLVKPPGEQNMTPSPGKSFANPALPQMHWNGWRQISEPCFMVAKNGTIHRQIAPNLRTMLHGRQKWHDSPLDRAKSPNHASWSPKMARFTARSRQISEPCFMVAKNGAPLRCDGDRDKRRRNTLIPARSVTRGSSMGTRRAILSIWVAKVAHSAGAAGWFRRLASVALIAGQISLSR